MFLCSYRILKVRFLFEHTSAFTFLALATHVSHNFFSFYLSIKPTESNVVSSFNAP